MLQSARSQQTKPSQRSRPRWPKRAESRKRESSAMLAEARAKRDEILAAEQELRKQLEGVQSVFESLQHGNVARDDTP